MTKTKYLDMLETLLELAKIQTKEQYVQHLKKLVKNASNN